MNDQIEKRLAGFQKALMGLNASGSGMSSASKGREREHFVDQFLRQCYPPTFRFGTGDVTDSAGQRSGQLDVVIEYPFAPSLTMGGSRLYLAESVAAVVEVKSNLANQWAEVEGTTAALETVQRTFGGIAGFGGINQQLLQGRIPFFAVGFSGWAKLDTVKEKVKDGAVDGILVIDQGLFAAGPRLGSIYASGAWSLWAFLISVQEALTAVSGTKVNLVKYGLQ